MWALNERQAPALRAGTLIGGDQGAEPGRVDELHPTQVEHERSRRIGLDRERFFLQRLRAGNIELADQDDPRLPRVVFGGYVERRHVKEAQRYTRRVLGRHPSAP